MRSILAAFIRASTIMTTAAIFIKDMTMEKTMFFLTHFYMLLLTSIIIIILTLTNQQLCPSKYMYMHM